MYGCFSINRKSRNREGSFSSYLDSSDEAFVRRLRESNIPKTHHKKQEEDDDEEDKEGEIGVFSAEKYFNGGIDEDIQITLSSGRSQQQCKKENSRNAADVKYKSGTPSLKSESSWNSHTQLLKGSLRNNSCRGNSSRKGQGWGLLYGLTCRCYCSDKDSVDVKEGADGEISFRGNQNLIPGKASPEAACQNLDSLKKMKKKKEVCFSFPTTPDTCLSANGEPKPPLTQNSIDVFGFPVNMKGNAKPFGINQRQLTGEPDNESDASSDLFEIESVTGRLTPFLASQTPDVHSGCVTPVYAPSEVSIDWSVVTASMADFSIVSDQEVLKPHSSRKASTVIERPRRRSSGGSLLGCKSGESVRVANDATMYKTKDKPKPETGTPKFRVSDSFSIPKPTVKVQAERKLSGFDDRYRHPHSFSPPNSNHPKISVLEFHR